MEQRTTLYSLSPPHAELTFTAEKPADQVSTELRELHASDKLAEKEAAKWRTRATIFFWLMLINGFIGFVVFPLLILVPVWLVPFLIFRKKRIAAENQDVDDRKVHAAGRLLHVLGPETMKKKPVKLFLDFFGYEKAPPESKQMSWGSGTMEWTKKWMEMSFMLLDGSRVSLEAISNVKRKQKAKRKWTKKKDRIVEDLVVTLKPPAGKALNPNGPKALAAMLEQHPTLELKRVQPKQGAVVCQIRTRPAVRQLTRYQGWTDQGLDALLDGDRTIAAVISTYRAFAGSHASDQTASPT